MGGESGARRIDAWLRDRPVRSLRDEPLAPRTTFRIGGPARILAFPATIEELAGLWRACAESEMPARILGSGANLLVGDEGVPGVVIHLGRLNAVSEDGPRLRAEAGASFPKLAVRAVRGGLRGFEGLGGIPATVGGAVFMNAGGRHGEIFDTIEAVEVLDAEGGHRVLARREIAVRYRSAGLEGCAIVAARFRLVPDDPARVQADFVRTVSAKRATQPMRERCAGCVFKNPGRDLSAGRAIEESGLKGLRVGDAMVSPKHANFIVNLGNARARDVLELIDRVRDAVRARRGFELEREVLVW